ncbi:hypothetical protein SAMN05877753_103113 [Bacillus oleivorans]|uniref:Uncharacterized protein n=1 Tax=Bacillus oleivorans TaxID=1448271 RepID=A0A285CR69_9BACI|nr:hypothetical protein SAMN05877753_103113 [Bacillus oleivorans]
MNSLYRNGGFPFDSINETSIPNVQSLIEYVEDSAYWESLYGIGLSIFKETFIIRLLKKEGHLFPSFFVVLKKTSSHARKDRSLLAIKNLYRNGIVKK